MLTSKERSALRREAMNIKAAFQIGKEGVSEAVIGAFEEYLLTNELLKARVLRSSPEEAREAADAIAEQVGADVVSVVGGVFVLYKKAQELS